MIRRFFVIFIFLICAFSTAARADIIQGKYGVAQVFDAQRNPAFPVPNNPVTYSSFAAPIEPGSGSYVMTSGQYIQFAYAGGTCNGGATNIEINLYAANGALIRNISAAGSIYGLDSKGFLHVDSGGTGTFISNQQGFSNGDSITFTPTSGSPGAGLNSCAELAAFSPSTTPLGVGQTASSSSALTQTRVSGIVRNYMARRADLLTADNLDLGSRLDRKNSTDLAGPVSVSGSGNNLNNNVAFSTNLNQIIQSTQIAKIKKRKELSGMMSLGQRQQIDKYNTDIVKSDFDIWIKGSYAHADNDANKTDLGLFYAGIDYRFSPDFLIGVIGQMDWTDESNKTESIDIDGKGWLVGPYMVARLRDDLVFSGRVSLGGSSNDVNPDGTHTNKFSTSRFLVNGKLVGNYVLPNNWNFSPHVGVIYFHEKQKSYTDSVAGVIASQSLSLGRLTFGPRVSYIIERDDGTSVSPYLGIKGIWDFKNAKTVDLVSGVPVSNSDDLRARVEGGLSTQLLNGWSLNAEAFYDGVGSSTLEAYGGSVKVTLPLN